MSDVRPAYIDQTLSDLAGITVSVDAETNMATVTMNVQDLNNILALAKDETYNRGKTKPVDPSKDEFGYKARDNRLSQVHCWESQDQIEILAARLSEANDRARTNAVTFSQSARTEASITRNRRGREYEIREAGKLWDERGLLIPTPEVTENNCAPHAVWLGVTGAQVLKDRELEALVNQIKASSDPLNVDLVNAVATAVARSAEASKAAARIKAAKAALK